VDGRSSGVSNCAVQPMPTSLYWSICWLGGGSQCIVVLVLMACSLGKGRSVTIYCIQRPFVIDTGTFVVCWDRFHLVIIVGKI